MSRSMSKCPDCEAKDARISELEDHAVLATLAKNNDQLRARIAELEVERDRLISRGHDISEDRDEHKASAERAEAELMPLKIKLAGAEAERDAMRKALKEVLTELPGDDPPGWVGQCIHEVRELVRATLAPPPAGEKERDHLHAERDAVRDGNRPLPYDRDHLGRLVREAWVCWAYTQPNPKPSWLMNYDELTEPDKEADRQIGESIARWTIIGDAARAARDHSPAETFRVPALTPDQEVHLKTLEPQPYDPDTMIGAPSPAGPDGKSLAVIYCMERAEEDVKLLREALEDMIAVAEGRFDGNPHADIDALAKARAARDHSLAGEKT